MAASPSVFVVLLRAIGPLTHKIMSMAQWRDGAAAAGFISPRTFLATGNMILEAHGDASDVTKKMNGLVAELGLGPSNVAVVRTPAQLRALVAANPFPDASADRPSQMGVYFFKAATPDFAWLTAYDGSERFAIVEGHLIVDYSGSIPQSRKLPGLIERRSGVTTARNWNTLSKLVEQASARERN